MDMHSERQSDNAHLPDRSTASLRMVDSAHNKTILLDAAKLFTRDVPRCKHTRRH